VKALKWYAKGDLRYEDVPEPSPGSGQVKVKVKWCGICGTDLHEYRAGPILYATEPNPLSGRCVPLIIGHEFSGDVVELGEGATNCKVGDRVTADAIWVCGKCYYCERNMPNLCLMSAYTGCHTDGAMAEYVVVPDYTIYRLPDHISYEVGALSDPLSCGVYPVRLSKLQEGDTVAIVGAGTIGLATLLAAKAAGASRVYVLEMSHRRRERALRKGATAVINPKDGDPLKQIQDLTGGLGVDFSFDCAGNPVSGPFAVELTRRGGTTVIVGITEQPSPNFSFNNICFPGKTVIGSICYVRDIRIVLELVQDGRIDPSGFITAKLALKDARLAFEELVKNPDDHVKILLHP
jgi:(R,R)-butanediol dehydrogenase/meso-butanediol dehydrogenase/diacetyl reductase